MTQHIKDLTQQRYNQISTSTTGNTGTSINTSTGNTSRQQGSSYDYECDQLYDMHRDLCGDSRFRPYYLKAFYTLGRERVIIMAAKAKQSSRPASAFGAIIKEELARCKKARSMT